MTPRILVATCLFVIGLLFFDSAPLVSGFFIGLATCTAMDGGDGDDDEDDEDDIDGAEPGRNLQPT